MDENQDGLFERVDFARLAMAFGIPLERVHEAVGKTGTLYRQRANRDKTRDELALEVERLRSALEHISNHELRDHEDYEAIQDIASVALISAL